MSSLRDLAKSMNMVATTVEANAIEAVKSVSRAAGTMVIYATPVDTSRARMNWQTTLNAPATSVLLPYPDRPADPSVGPSTALNTLRTTVENYNGQPNGVYIANNVAYIQMLNDGSSSQAPANFVAKSVIAAAESIKNVKLLP